MYCAECDWKKGFYLDLMLFKDAFSKTVKGNLILKLYFPKPERSCHSYCVNYVPISVNAAAVF